MAKTVGKKTAPKKVANEPRRPKKALHMTVVDEHHHVMKPIWDAVTSKTIPSKGNTFIHFYSHPDMGCIGSDSKGKDLDRCKRMVPQIYRNSFNRLDCLRLSEISTWLPTLVYQGLVDEVVWIAGWWCRQFATGSYKLLLGRCKTNGHMKVAVPGDKKLAILEYWSGDDSVAKEANLEDVRPWTLHVVKFRNNCELPEEGVAKIKAAVKGKPWILDIDEDYLSCQNPPLTQFKQFFGGDTADILAEVFNQRTDDDLKFCTALEKIVTDDIFMLSQTQYAQHAVVQEIADQIVKGGRQRATAFKLLEQFRETCREIRPAEPEDGDFLHPRAYYDADQVAEVGSLNSLPHHISTMDQILKMMDNTRSLFQQMSRPRVVTIATSRADYYTPEMQAPIINRIVLDTLTDIWEDAKVHRRDFDKYLSIEDCYDPIKPSRLALFLSRRKEEKLPAWKK